MYTFATQSKAIFGFNFRNSVQHMASSFRVDPVFNYTFVPVSSLLFLCRIPVFLVEIPFLFSPFAFPSVPFQCLCLHLLPVSAILSSNPTLSRLCYLALCCVCACVVWNFVYLCHTLSPKLDVLMRVWHGRKEGHGRFKAYFPIWTSETLLYLALGLYYKSCYYYW